MPVVRHHTPCKQCPFRRASINGYLGASTPEEFMDATLGENHMPCHLTVDYDRADWRQQLEQASFCAGSLIFLRNNCKLPRNEELRDATRQVEPDRENVFCWRDEFEQHHEGSPNIGMNREEEED